MCSLGKMAKTNHDFSGASLNSGPLREERHQLRASANPCRHQTLSAAYDLAVCGPLFLLSCQLNGETHCGAQDDRPGGSRAGGAVPVQAMLTSSTEPTPRMGQLSAARAFAWELLTTMRLAGDCASPFGLRCGV